MEAAHSHGRITDDWLDDGVDGGATLYVVKKAGKGRIVPIGGGVYYVGGIYGAVGGIVVDGILGDFHFKVEDGQAVLLDAVAWSGITGEGPGGGDLNEQATTLLQGHWLSDLIVDDQITVVEQAVDISVDVRQAIVYVGYGSFVALVSVNLDYRNVGDEPVLIGRYADSDPEGEILESYKRLVDQWADMPYGALSYLPATDLDAGETGIGSLKQLLPGTAFGFETADIRISQVPPGDPDAELTTAAVVHIALAKPPLCTQISNTDDAITADTCISPRVLYNE